MSWLFREVPPRLLLKLEEGKSPVSVTGLWKEVGFSYSQVLKVIKKLGTFGLVSLQPQGRDLEISLTEKGKEVVDNIKGVNEKVL